jgi:hypothetical protein
MTRDDYHEYVGDDDDDDDDDDIDTSRTDNNHNEEAARAVATKESIRTTGTPYPVSPTPSIIGNQKTLLEIITAVKTAGGLVYLNKGEPDLRISDIK